MARHSALVADEYHPDVAREQFDIAFVPWVRTSTGLLPPSGQ